MADYRTIKPTIWSDPYFEELNSYEKLLYIYLFSNPHINNAGVMKVSHRKIIFETFAEDVQFESAIKKFENDKKVMLFGEYIYVCNFIKHQTNTSSKMLINIHKQLELIPRDIVSVINHQYPELKIPQRYLTDTVSIPHKYPTDGLEKELELELELEREVEREVELRTHDASKSEEKKPSYLPSEYPIKDAEHVSLPECIDRVVWQRWIQYLAKSGVKKLVDDTINQQHHQLILWHKEGISPKDVVENAIAKGIKSLVKPYQSTGGERKSEAPHRSNCRMQEEAKTREQRSKAGECYNLHVRGLCGSSRGKKPECQHCDGRDKPGVRPETIKDMLAACRTYKGEELKEQQAKIEARMNSEAEEDMRKFERRKKQPEEVGA